MNSLEVALWASGALAAAALGPAAWVLARNARLNRAGEVARAKVALAEQEARRAIDGDVTAVVADLGRRFDGATNERVVERLLASDDGGEQRFGRALFAAFGFGDRYVERLARASRWSERAHAASVLGRAGAVLATPALVAALRDPDEDTGSVKAAAAEALGRIEDPAAVPLLVAELRHVDEHASRSVVEALVRFGAVAVDPLVGVLGSPEHGDGRIWAARILGQLGDARAVDALVARLHDRDDRLRMSAAEALGRVADRRATQALVQAMLRDPAPRVRAHAAAAIAKVEGERAVDVLVSALADPDHATRMRALEAFESIEVSDTRPLELALRDPMPDVRKRAALALDRIGYTDRLVAELDSDDAEAVEAARLALVEMGRVGLADSIAAHLAHASFSVRTRLAQICGALGNPSVAPRLLPALDDPEWPVRAAVCEAVGKLRLSAAPPLLVDHLVDPEEPVREAAAEAIDAYPANELAPFVDRLVASYERGSVPVRRYVVQVAARVGGPSAERLVVRATEDPSDAVRLRAVQMASGLPEAALVEPLVARLADPLVEVRMAAIASLGSASSAEAFEGLLRALPGAPRDVRDRITESLAHGGRELFVSRAEELATQAELDVRLGVAWTLGKIADASGVPLLGKMLRDPDAALRASAAGALAKIDHVTSRDALLGATDDPDARTRAAVVNGLARRGDGDERVVGALARRLRDPDAFVRGRALLAIARAAGPAALPHLTDEDVVASADEARLTIALALSRSDEGVRAAIDRVAVPGASEKVRAALRGEEPSVARAFAEATRLDLGGGPAASGDDLRALAENYAQLLRSSLSTEERTLAVDALGRLRSDAGIDALTDALAADPAESVRRGAALALATHSHDARARGALVRAVGDPDVEVACRAIAALSGSRDREALEALVRRISTSDARVRDAAECALAEAFRDDPVPVVDRLLGAEVPEQIAAGVRVLGRIGASELAPLLVELSRSADADVRLASVRAIGALPAPRPEATLDEALSDPSEVVRAAVASACDATEVGVARAARASRDPSPRVRGAAAAALGRAKSTRALSVLEEAVEDLAPEVAAAALVSLLERADGDALRAFARAFQKTGSGPRRGMREDPRAEAVSASLARLLAGSPDPAMRQQAVLAVSSLGVAGSTEALLASLADPVPRVRAAAARTLASVDTPEVRARLSSLLNDPEPEVRDAARRSIVREVR